MRSAQPKLPNGVWGQLRTLLFHPETFFKALSTSTSAWLFMLVVLMLLTGASEVQRQQRLNASPSDGMNIDFGIPPMDTGMPMGDPTMPEMPGGGVPLPPSDMGGGGAPTGGQPITEQLEQILGATGSILGMWLVLTPLLAIVPFFNRSAPRWGRALKVAIWASVPLGVMALIQLAYYSAGGKAGEPGMFGIVDELPFYASLSAIQKSLVLSAASKLTLFHGWMLALVYLGARQTLRGKQVVVVIVMALWLMLMIFLPVATGAYKVEEELPAVQTLPDGSMGGENSDFMGDEMPDEGMTGDNSEMSLEDAASGDVTSPDGESTGEDAPVKPVGGKRR